MLLRLACYVIGHRVDRHRVWHDRLDFRTACRRCGTPLIRAESGWRAYRPATDEDPERDQHPRDRADTTGQE